jgi:hypothetical protein
LIFVKKLIKNHFISVDIYSKEVKTRLVWSKNGAAASRFRSICPQCKPRWSNMVKNTGIPEHMPPVLAI